eukprot:CAMPEP_0116880778 /NCGR_PEP_ID=MMETSP0463-20121206/12761_1 /TAXON_ID=181622 /ORGANISM="Strombidinopsis sp, Strain SopsisLIS2011" /LENGTH=91 /DNA_ID=CAMNT_0004531805 /DNA_START=277 /DNA_END=552 /DNA_ORIENTATION=-
MIWADPCSYTFLRAFEISVSWIAALSALEGASGCGLGYVDYKMKTGNSEDMVLVMRKKRLAFAKFSFIAATGTLMLLDEPSPNCVLPLMAG